MEQQSKSYLDLVQECDGLPYPDQPEYSHLTSSFYRFRLKEKWSEEISEFITIGWMLPSVVEKMPWIDKFRVDHEQRIVDIPYNEGEDFESRAIAEQLAVACEADSFEILRNFKAAQYRILHIDRPVRMGRSGSALFGIQTMGVHVTGYTQDKQTGELIIYIARRSQTQRTYPGMFDNMVGGGIRAEEDQFECMIRKAKEEASLPEDWMREHAQSVGTISYFLIRGHRAGSELGLLQPATQYMYDVALPASIQPRPSDKEVEEFYPWTVDQTIDALKKGQFKPNCAIAMIDFLIRHGRITAGNEPDFHLLVSRIHRRLHF